MAGLLLSMFVAAMDSTVVGTALPTIARELGEFSLYPWIFSGYLLTSTTTVPLWGRLADLHGRRRVLMVGLSLFIGASVLCGLAPGMTWLILFRALQGLGAGCIQPVTLTIVGDIFPLQQRARLQGFFSGTWALASVLGPLLGATFVSTIGWRWIFVINLPIGLAAVWMLFGYAEKRHHAGGGGFDVFGAALLTVAIALLLYGLGTGTSDARPVWPAAAGAAVLLAAVAWWETRPGRGVVPVELLAHGVIGPAVLASMLAGVVMFGVTAYAPLFVQGALGGTAFAAGAAVAPMSLGWPVGSVTSGRLLARGVGYQSLIVAGGLGMVVGSVLLVVVGHTVLMVGIAAAFVGLGLGLLSTPVLIVVQSAVDWARRGGATALVQFSRTIGGAVGVSLMGVLLQARLAGVAADPLRAGGALARTSLAAGIESVFWVVLGMAVLVLVITVGILVARRPETAA